MSGTVLGIDRIVQRHTRPPGSGASRRAIAASAPSIITFAITIGLFASLNNFGPGQLRLFTITVMTAVIVSLVGTAPLSPFALGIIGDGTRQRAAVNRVVLRGAAFSALWASLTGAALYRFMTLTVGLSTVDFGLLTALIFMQSLVWITMSTYLATRHYAGFASIFVLGYAFQFALTLALHSMNPDYTLAGYTAGIAALLWAAIYAVKRVYGVPATAAMPGAWPAMVTIARKSGWAVVFHILYTASIFLDKILVWLWTGHQNGEGLTISGSYTIGAFLGLVPLFALGVTIHFETVATPLVKAIYQGRFSDIQGVARAYKRLYLKDRIVLFLIGLGFLAAAAFSIRHFFPGDGLLLKVMLTAGAGAIVFSVIVFDYMVLSLFGETRISALCMLVVCVFEMASLPLIRYSTWYAAAGFLAGSVCGALISQATTLTTLHSFEFHIFHYATTSSLDLAREERLKQVREEKRQ